MIGIDVQDGWTNKEIANQLIEDGLAGASPPVRACGCCRLWSSRKRRWTQGVAIMKKTLGLTALKKQGETVFSAALAAVATGALTYRNLTL